MSEVEGGHSIMDKYLIRHESTASRTIGGVALIVNAPEGMLRSLNKVGTLIWEQANGKHTFSQIVEQVCQNYDVDYSQAVQDAELFVKELESKNMLTLIDQPTSSEKK